MGLVDGAVEGRVEVEADIGAESAVVAKDENDDVVMAGGTEYETEARDLAPRILARLDLRLALLETGSGSGGRVDVALELDSRLDSQHERMGVSDNCLSMRDRGSEEVVCASDISVAAAGLNGREVEDEGSLASFSAACSASPLPIAWASS